MLEWEAGKRLTMRVVDTNLPIKTADIRFELRASRGGTLVILSPDYALKYGWLGVALDGGYVRRRYRNSMNALLAGLKRHVEARRS